MYSATGPLLGKDREAYKYSLASRFTEDEETFGGLSNPSMSKRLL